MVAELRAGAMEAKRMDAKHLTFSLGEEQYGIEILRVKEIIGMLPVTPIPRTPPQVKGVINLRGKVIPVVDLRINFGLEEVEAGDRTCIIVVEVAQADGLIQMGVDRGRGQRGAQHQGRGSGRRSQLWHLQCGHRVHHRHGQDPRRGQNLDGHRSGAGRFPGGRPDVIFFAISAASGR